MSKFTLTILPINENAENPQTNKFFFAIVTLSKVTNSIDLIENELVRKEL